MKIITVLLQSISVPLPLEQSVPDFFQSMEVKLLVWKTVQKNLNNIGFVVLTGGMELAPYFLDDLHHLFWTGSIQNTKIPEKYPRRSHIKITDTLYASQNPMHHKIRGVFFCVALFLAIMWTLRRNYKGSDTANLRYIFTFILDVFRIRKQMINHRCGLEWNLISKQVTCIKSHNVLSFPHKDC